MFNRAKMFNKRAANPKFKSDEIIKILEIKKGSIIADIGSGGGFFTMLFSQKVGKNGQVYAVDINEKNLKYINKLSKERKLSNIKTILADNNVSGLTSRECDLIFLRNSYHHIKNPKKYFTNIKKYLKNNGRVVIIDYKKNEKKNFFKFMHQLVNEEEIIETMKKCNYIHVKSYDFIKSQSFNIFKKNNE